MAVTAAFSDVTPRTLRCSTCGGNAIPTPAGTTPKTRFTCYRCCARLARRKSIAEGRAFGAEERALVKSARKRLVRRRERIAAGVAKTPLEADREVTPLQRLA